MIGSYFVLIHMKDKNGFEIDQKGYSRSMEMTDKNKKLSRHYAIWHARYIFYSKGGLYEHQEVMLEESIIYYDEDNKKHRKKQKVDRSIKTLNEGKDNNIDQPISKTQQQEQLYGKKKSKGLTDKEYRQLERLLKKANREQKQRVRDDFLE